MPRCLGMDPEQMREQARLWRDIAKWFDKVAAEALLDGADELEARAERLEEAIRQAKAAPVRPPSK